MPKLFFILAAFLYLAASCNKEYLPEYYFRCKVNGEEYVPDNCANCRTGQILQDTVLMIGGISGNATLGIGINDGGGIKAGTYLLNEVIGRRGDYKNSMASNDRYFTDAARTGQLVITTLDKSNRIIAGTFSYVAYNAVQNKTVSVTGGKFRLQYRAY